MKYSEPEDSVGHAGHPSVMPAMDWPATTAAPIHASVRAAMQATLRELPSTKALIRKLFDTLDQANVSYCHWKSNIRIEGTLAGDEDIDLLVQRRDAERFETVLLATGFKFVQSYGGVGHPGVFNALALDDATSGLVHLHAHYQIVGGDSLVKNYRFPLEDLLLRHTRTIHGVKVPDAEVDLLLFLLRVALKHTSLIEICKVNLHYKKISAELAWLLEVADVKETQALLEQWLPMVEPALVHDLLRAITDNGAVLRRIGLGWRLAWRLREFRRLGSVRSALSRQWRLLWYVIGRFQRRRDFVPLAGGLVVALVGPKASGKSTIGSQLAARLGRHLVVTRIHAGKPPATALSVLPRLFVPMARKLLPHERLGEYEKPEGAWRKPTRFSMCCGCFCWHMIGERCCFGLCARRPQARSSFPTDIHPAQSGQSTALVSTRRRRLDVNPRSNAGSCNASGSFIVGCRSRRWCSGWLPQLTLPFVEMPSGSSKAAQMRRPCGGDGTSKPALSFPGTGNSNRHRRAIGRDHPCRDTSGLGSALNPASS